MVPLIIDIVLLLILAFSVWRGVSKGLILSVVSLIAVIAVFFGARYIAENYSEKFQDVIAPLVSSTVADAATDERMEQDIEYDTADRSTLEKAAKSIFDRLGIYKNATDKMAEQAISEVNGETTFRSAVSKQYEKTLAYIFVFIIAYLLLNIIVSVIINLCNVLFKLPGLRMLNALGGGIAGLIVGLMVVFAIAWAVRYLGFMAKDDIIGSTKVLKFFAESNPFNTWLSV